MQKIFACFLTKSVHTFPVVKSRRRCSLVAVEENRLLWVSRDFFQTLLFIKHGVNASIAKDLAARPFLGFSPSSCEPYLENTGLHDSADAWIISTHRLYLNEKTTSPSFQTAMSDIWAPCLWLYKNGIHVLSATFIRDHLKDIFLNSLLVMSTLPWVLGTEFWASFCSLPSVLLYGWE